MQTLLRQLTLSLSSKDEATFADFYPGKNTEIVTELKKMAAGIGERVIYVSALRGEGSSHLLQALCHEASLHQLTSVYLPLRHLLQMSKDALNGLETLDLICIDEIEAIAGNALWEEAIFHLYNRILSEGGRIVIAGCGLPKALNIQLPDLVSRLSHGVVYQLSALEDEEKLVALNMRANRRGMTLSDDVGRYLLTHCPRHMGTLFAALDALDKASLAAQRRLTIPFVKEILQI